MPKVGLKNAFDLTTRNAYTKVEAEVSMMIDGKELPSMAVMGEALEKAIELIQKRVTESYKVIPPRVDTPMAEPYKPPEPVNVPPPVTVQRSPFGG